MQIKMGDFSTAYQITANNEGGYANNPNDKGGETYDGIARNSHLTWPGWILIDTAKKQPNFPSNLKSNGVLAQMVMSFYQANYWAVNALDRINNQQICNEMFDIGVNMGVYTAAEYLQRSLNLSSRNGKDYAPLKVDTVIGATTLNTINNHPRPAEVFKLITTLQGAHYIQICENDPTQEVFMLGWLNRIMNYK
jgi:lysozyme family protein